MLTNEKTPQLMGFTPDNRLWIDRSSRLYAILENPISLSLVIGHVMATMCVCSQEANALGLLTAQDYAEVAFLMQAMEELQESSLALMEQGGVS